MNRTDQVGDYITLAKAGEIAGYSGGYGNLRRAAAMGQLRTVLVGKTRLTTQEWLDAYLAKVRSGNYKRGQPKSQDSGDAVEKG